MTHSRRWTVALLAAVVLATPALACIWDHDTLAMERRRFPSALELITGAFLRHSSSYYEWRIDDRTRRLRDDPSPALYDDLAVAYEKLGDHDRAIALMREKEQEFPGLYETQANLGTFLIHAGKLTSGLDHLERAIAINPDAHFGREVYQKLLVEYVLSRQTNGTTTLPLDARERYQIRSSGSPIGFAAFVLDAHGIDDDRSAQNAELDRAVHGVLGMMRFGTHDSPVLLEALGDLLLARGYPEDAKRLAGRAYLLASYGVDDEDARSRYRDMVEQCLGTQTFSASSERQLTVDELERRFADEREIAQRWFQALADDEARWAREGRDLDAAFAEAYPEEPDLLPVPFEMPRWIVTVAGLVLLATGVVIVRTAIVRALRAAKARRETVGQA